MSEAAVSEESVSETGAYLAAAGGGGGGGWGEGATPPLF